MVINRLTLTYSLLAQIKETSSNESTSLIDLFIPMVKQSISDFCEVNGVLLCENIADIKSQLQKTFLIDIPIPVLRTILGQIEMEINDKNLFQVFSDWSCIIKRTHYDDLMPIISKGEKALSLLQEDFKNYCSICKIDYNFDKLENFIRSQQIELFTKHNINYTNIEPEIPNYLELKLKSSDQEIFNTISNIFIGGIITDYITLKYDSTVVKNTELLVDTNFIISLLDLNTVDATCTCKDLLRLCQSMGFSFKIFNKTINQINFLLNDRIENFKDRNFGWVKQNDIFAACVRRKLTKTELEFIKDNLLRSLEKFKISIIYDAQIDKLLLQAKMSKSYKILSQIRQNSESALLDSLAEVYVNQRRGNNISCFADIKCWFLHNSTNPTKQKVDIKQRWSISADELLTMLWLTNPAQCNDLTSKEVAKSCLTAYISKFRDSKCPERQIILDLSKKAQKFAENGQVTNEAVYTLLSRMSEGGLSSEEAQRYIDAQDDTFITKLNDFQRKNYSHFDDLTIQTKNIEQLREQNAQLEKDNKQLIADNKHKSESYKQEQKELTAKIEVLTNELKETKNKLDVTVSENNSILKKMEDNTSKEKQDWVNDQVNKYILHFRKLFRWSIILLLITAICVGVYCYFESDILKYISGITGVSTLIGFIKSMFKKGQIGESSELKKGAYNNLKTMWILKFGYGPTKDDLLDNINDYYEKRFDKMQEKRKQ